MKTVYLVCSTVDLGYHAEYGYTSIEKAEAKYEDFFLVFASEIKDFIQ